MAVYSTNPEIEARLLDIRHDPANRVKRMAEQRVNVGRQLVPFQAVELLWITEEDRFSETIPVLSPQEYWAMIRNLAADLKKAYASLNGFEESYSF